MKKNKKQRQRKQDARQRQRQRQRQKKRALDFSEVMEMACRYKLLTNQGTKNDKQKTPTLGNEKNTF